MTITPLGPSPFLAGFTLADITLPALRLRAALSSDGPGLPVLLLHGHPQTHATWHAVAPASRRPGTPWWRRICGVTASPIGPPPQTTTRPTPSAPWQPTWSR